MRLSFGNRYLFAWIFLTTCFLCLQKFKYETALADRNCIFGNDGQDAIQTQSNAINSTTATAVRTESTSYPFHPFVEGQSKSVVVLSYQRCGSSFFSDMFNLNPRTFYYFEPIDSIYSSVYGTATGWNVPSDITGHRNGSLRSLTDVEISKVSQFLLSLLTCRVNDLPMETLTHRYLYKDFYQEPNPYVRCISNQTLKEEAERCLALAPVSFCGPRFGEATERRHDECRRLLTEPDLLRNHTKRTLFAPYISCRKRIRRMFLDTCGRTLSKICSERLIHAVKTVRATMESMEPLLSALPNFRVIHLIRDPRAVMLSRKKFDASAKTLYSIDRNLFIMATEARLFCQTVARDIRVRIDLEKRFPGRIYSMFYEDVMEEFKTYTGNIYAFLNASSPVTSGWWRRKVLGQHTDASKKIVYRWRTELKFKENRSIVASCEELFELVGNRWER